MSDNRHPEDFGPYLVRESSDPESIEIGRHLEDCPRCLDEVRSWRALDELVRSGAAEIEVPPFQWQRIAAQLGSSDRAGFLGRIRSLMRPRVFAWKMTLATLALGAMVVTGVELRRNNEERRILLTISNYAAAEQHRTTVDENPFRSKTVSNHADESNPFAVRR